MQSAAAKAIHTSEETMVDGDLWRKRTDKSPLERRAVENNGHQMKRPYGKKLQRRWSEVVERRRSGTR